MLLELQISDFAIIDRLHLRLNQGFNVLTGETGAGKSIIIDALGMLRGDKPDPTFVRAGASRARIEGIFSLHDCPDLAPLLDEYGLADAEDDQIILTRELSAESGRSVARINGRAVNTSVLREVGARLVDIHGQHEGLALFNIRTHLDMLDRFGELLPLREAVAAEVAELRRLREELAGLRRDERRRAERIQELRFLLEDVQAARLRAEEEDELLKERTMVQNAVRITDLATRAYDALYKGADGGRLPVRPMAEVMVEVAADLAELARFDLTVAPLAQQAEDLRYQLEDLVESVRSYQAGLDFDPARIDALEDRLTVIRDLQRKYGAAVPTLLERAANAETEIERLENSATYIADLEAREATQRDKLGALASKLSQRRQATGDEMATLIGGAMADLAMPRVRFQVATTQTDDPQGVSYAPAAGSATRRVRFDKTGVDQVEFLIAPNPGEPLKPLARIASGGESARLLLALKSILARVDPVATMVFDEIDVGVGGRAGQVVGQKLWAITGAHQVICITHLPQVAAFADAHYAISKEFGADRTRTRIDLLSADERVDELAAMLDGTPISEQSRANARGIIERAQFWKEERLAQSPASAAR